MFCLHSIWRREKTPILVRVYTTASISENSASFGNFFPMFLRTCISKSQTLRNISSEIVKKKKKKKQPKFKKFTKNFQMFKLDLEKAEGPEIKLLTSVGL